MKNHRPSSCGQKRALFIIIILYAIANTCFALYQPGAGLQKAQIRKAEGLALVEQALKQAPGREADEDQVEDAEKGEMEVVNAAWWGFDPDDATQAIQSAIYTHAPVVVVPNMDLPWIVREPLFLVSHQTILLEEGVEIRAKRHAFKDAEECLFVGSFLDDFRMMGYGATLRMWRDDYQGPEYIHDEMRHIFYLAGVRNLELRGLVLSESGGDGVLLSDILHPKVKGKPVSTENVKFLDCRFERNHRQGLSIEDGTNFLAENCEFVWTAGTAPANGMDLEPMGITSRKAVHVVFRHCRFFHNAGGEITVNRGAVGPDTPPDSILFDHCRFGGSDLEGITITQFNDAHPKPEGYLEFRDCLVENTGYSGVRVSHKSALATPVRFVRCAFRNVATKWDGAAYQGKSELAAVPENQIWQGRPIYPFYLYLPHDNTVKSPGGFEFVDTILEDDRNRPILVAEENKTSHGWQNITGNIILYGKHEPTMWLDAKAGTISLTLTREEGRLPDWEMSEEAWLEDLEPAKLKAKPGLEISTPPQKVNLEDFSPDPKDATAAFQAAIDSRARIIKVPRQDKPYVLGPLYLRGNQEFLFDSGVELLAKADAYADDQAGMFNVIDRHNVILRAKGRGAILDLSPIQAQAMPFNLAAMGRHGIMLLGAQNVRIENFTIWGAQDNGIAVGSNYLFALFYPSRHVRVKDCRFSKCARGAIALYSADAVTIEDCHFADNGSEGPGLALKPAPLICRLSRIQMKDCQFEKMSAPALAGYFGQQVRYGTRQYPQREMSVLVQNCEVLKNNGPAVMIRNLFSATDSRTWGKGRQTGHWRGLIHLRDCTLESIDGAAIAFKNKSALSAPIRFQDCQLLPGQGKPAVLMEVDGDKRLSTASGGVGFIHCRTSAEKALSYEGASSAVLEDVQGRILSKNGKNMLPRIFE